MPSSESQDNTVASTVIDLRKADALYKPFPPFSDWVGCSVDTVRFERYSAELDKLKEESEDALKRALEIVKRAAAIDTGAIEGLYETDRGFTFTVAVESAHWETALAEKGANVRQLFESQLKAYDYVLDFATQRIPVAEAWIRELHKVVCESQDTYDVRTAVGKQNQPLPKGEYKKNPNHVVQRDGSVHSWAPVNMTSAEMHRLCEELRSNAFSAAHPILQSSYAHYAFVSVHPFADGNGRVARALASVFTYRALSIPLLILKGDAKYLPALEAADRGDLQRFVAFVLDKVIDTIRVTDESFKAAKAPSLEAALNELTGLYLRKHAETHAKGLVDEVGKSFFDAFEDQINERFDSIDLPSVVAVEHVTMPVRTALRTGYRAAIRNASGFRISSAAPFAASVSRVFQVEAPTHAEGDYPMIVRGHDSDDTFEARFSELSPIPNASVRMRLSVWGDKLISEALNELSQAATSFNKDA